MNTKNIKDKKVKIRIENSSDEAETVWATPLGEDKYILENSPFHAYGLSWKDVIEAHLSNDGVLEFKKIVKKSNNKTIRIMSTKDASIAQNFIEKINSLGCTVEAYNSKYMAMNIPQTANFEHVVNFIQESQYEWEYADPTYEEVRGLN